MSGARLIASRDLNGEEALAAARAHESVTDVLAIELVEEAAGGAGGPEGDGRDRGLALRRGSGR